jgi:carbamoyl-phosphate synthase small subunit
MKFKANKNLNAVLCLSDGSFFFGKGVGKKGETHGEICFNTAITGYQEILTDPSYAGQIINFTFPHIGNVGCNNDDNEAQKVFCHGLVIREDITQDSNFRSKSHLNTWLVKHGLTGISGIDTRALTRTIRTKGAGNVIIAFVAEGKELDTKKLTAKIAKLPTLNGMELCSKVSTKKVYKWTPQQVRGDTVSSKYSTLSTSHSKLVTPHLLRGPSTNLPEKFTHGYNVVVMDYGVKENILNCLVDHGFKITVLPAQSSFAEILKHKPDGVFLSNGPGDPFATSQYAAPVIRKILENKIPIFGICMGHQLLSIAAGLSTTKMFQGHRGANHPVKNLKKGVVEITSQNHGFCVPQENMPSNIEVTHISLFDNTIEGIRLKNRPAFSVQYHPESSPGPHDSRYLFEQFIELISNTKKS